MLLHRERRGPEAVLVVTTRTVRIAETASVGVAVTVIALLEPELPISPLRWELGRVAALARNISVQTLERELRLRVSAKADFPRKA